MARGPQAAVRIAVLNGPNLNLLGTREPELYGHETLDDIERRLRAAGKDLGVDLEFAQHNGEGELVDAVHALVGVAMPFVEVHITNVFARERERRRSMLASAAVGVVCGLGALGYELALRGLVAHLAAHD